MTHKLLKFSLIACLCKLSQMSLGAASEPMEEPKATPAFQHWTPEQNLDMIQRFHACSHASESFAKEILGDAPYIEIGCGISPLCTLLPVDDALLARTQLAEPNEGSCSYLVERLEINPTILQCKPVHEINVKEGTHTAILHNTVDVILSSECQQDHLDKAFEHLAQEGISTINIVRTYNIDFKLLSHLVNDLQTIYPDSIVLPSKKSNLFDDIEFSVISKRLFDEAIAPLFVQAGQSLFLGFEQIKGRNSLLLQELTMESRSSKFSQLLAEIISSRKDRIPKTMSLRAYYLEKIEKSAIKYGFVTDRCEIKIYRHPTVAGEGTHSIFEILISQKDDEQLHAELITLKKDEAQSLKLTADRCFKTKDYDRAYHSYMASYQIKPNAVCLSNAALAAFKLKRWKESVRLCDRVIALAETESVKPGLLFKCLYRKFQCLDQLDRDDDLMGERLSLARRIQAHPDYQRRVSQDEQERFRLFMLQHT